MKNKILELQKQINLKSEELAVLQKEMLSAKKMIGASLIKRHLGTKNQKRTSHAFYLSSSIDGKTKLRYVSKHKVPLVKIQVAEWRKYQQELKRWSRLTESIWQDLKQLGKIQNQLGQ